MDSATATFMTHDQASSRRATCTGIHSHDVTALSCHQDALWTSTADNDYIDVDDDDTRDSMVLCGSARLLSQPAYIAPGLRSGLRWLKGSGDDPVGCG